MNSNTHSLEAIPESALRRERRRRGWSQVELARRAGCCLNTVSLAERIGHVSPAMAQRLGRALGIEPRELQS